MPVKVPKSSIATMHARHGDVLNRRWAILALELDNLPKPQSKHTRLLLYMKPTVMCRLTSHFACKNIERSASR